MPTYGDASAEDQNLLTANLSWEEQKLITVKRQKPLNNHSTEVIPQQRCVYVGSAWNLKPTRSFRRNFKEELKTAAGHLAVSQSVYNSQRSLEKQIMFSGMKAGCEKKRTRFTIRRMWWGGILYGIWTFYRLRCFCRTVSRLHVMQVNMLFDGEMKRNELWELQIAAGMKTWGRCTFFKRTLYSDISTKVKKVE